MQVTPFDPVHASCEDMTAWREVLNAMIDSDLPGEPVWQPDRLRDYLAVTMPDEHRLSFAARDESGTIAGHANLTLFGGGLERTGIFEIFVHPRARRSGAGRALLREVAEQAKAHGRDTVGVEVIATTPAVGFYDRLGFSRAVVENRNLLRMREVDWDKVTDLSGRLAAGYRLEYYTRGLPERLLERYATTKAHLKAVPDAAVAWRGSADARRLRDSLDTLAGRGMRTHLVVAIVEATEAVAGLTELVVASQRPTRADQFDTVVAPEHRSYGLGLAMKARMLRELAGNEPQLHDVQTWTALEGDPYTHVDAELGFRNDVQWFEYEADVADLLNRL